MFRKLISKRNDFSLRQIKLYEYMHRFFKISIKKTSIASIYRQEQTLIDVYKHLKISIDPMSTLQCLNVSFILKLAASHLFRYLNKHSYTLSRFMSREAEKNAYFYVIEKCDYFNTFNFLIICM